MTELLNVTKQPTTSYMSTTHSFYSKATEVKKQQIIITIVFLLVIAFLAVFFCLTKQIKKRRGNNQCFLFETLLLSDACYLSFSLPLVYTFNHKYLESSFRLVFGCIVNTFTLISMEMYIFLSLDIYIAVRYSLQYAIIFPLTRVKLFVSRALIATTFVSVFLHTEPPTREYSRNSRIGFNILTIMFRFVTPVTIQTFGWVTKSARNKTKNDLEQRRRVFGENAEKLSTMRGMRRQVKDMAILNTWNALFLIPLGVCTIIHLVDFKESVSQLDISLRLIHSTLGPFVTILSQSSYRNDIKKIFKLKKVGNQHL